jgi:hypothetical protein
VKAWLAAGLLVLGCAAPRPAVSPLPCDLLDDHPGLRSELHSLKAVPGDPWRRVRNYAYDADEACAGDRALGAPPLTPKPVPLPWYTRSWRWFVRLVAF